LGSQSVQDEPVARKYRPLITKHRDTVAEANVCMSFLIVILVGSLIAFIPQYIWGDRRDHRMAMRHGLAIGLSVTGVDHFPSATSRYVPMMPDFLSGAALSLVYFTGVAELAGALGLVIPAGVYRAPGTAESAAVSGNSVGMDVRPCGDRERERGHQRHGSGRP
jgi:hypothetical protein